MTFASAKDIESVIGNGHAMGVAGQVLEHVFRSAKWRLGVDHPILPEQLPQKAMKRAWVRPGV